MSIRGLKAWSHLAGLLLLLTALTVRAALPEPVSTALRQAGIAPDSVSAIVRPADDSTGNTPLVNHHADRPLNPASTMKVLTTYAALNILGPAYRWRTEVYRLGELHNGILQGDIIIKGYGDPLFMAEDLWRMLNQLRQMGVREIRGNLVLDSSYFAPQSQDSGAFDNEPYRAYNALPSAFMVNLKASSFRFYADGDHVGIAMEPWLEDIRVINQMRLVPANCGDWRSRMAYIVSPGTIRLAEQPVSNPLSEVTFSGEFAESCGEKYLDLSLLENDTYSYALFRRMWQQLGGSISGGVEQKPLPEGAVKLFTQESEALADIIRRLNKYSNNLMARQLLLTMAAERGTVPATEAGGVSVIQSWLKEQGLHFPELVMENGSGLSRNERISAEHMAELLADAYKSPVMPELMSSFPVLAVDGTLMRRAMGNPAAGRAHLKTGSLNGVSALAGYVLDAKGRRWCVVFMANLPQAGATRSAQDALIEWVYRQP